MDYDFALITLKDSGASAGYMGMDYGNSGSQVTLNLTTAGYPVRVNILPHLALATREDVH
jgi:hypothetical protein